MVQHGGIVITDGWSNANPLVSARYPTCRPAPAVASKSPQEYRTARSVTCSAPTSALPVLMPNLFCHQTYAMHDLDTHLHSCILRMPACLSPSHQGQSDSCGGAAVLGTG